MKSYIVIGLGLFGTEVAKQLCSLGCEVLAMDIHSNLVQQVANDVTHAVVGDGQDKEVLKALDAGSFDCAIIAIGDDLAASILTTMNLKELNVPYIVCKAHDETHRRVLEKLGVRENWPGAFLPTMCSTTLSFPKTTEFWKCRHLRAGSGKPFWN